MKAFISILNPRRLAILLIGLLVVGSNLFLVGSFLWPYNILSVQEPFKILTPVVKNGTSVEYQLVYTKRYQISGRVIVQLVNTHAVTIADFPSNMLKGSGTATGSHKTPFNIMCPPEKGPYYLTWTAIYHPWPWLTKEYIFKSEVFSLTS